MSIEPGTYRAPAPVKMKRPGASSYTCHSCSRRGPENHTADDLREVGWVGFAMGIRVNYPTGESLVENLGQCPTCTEAAKRPHGGFSRETILAGVKDWHRQLSDDIEGQCGQREINLGGLQRCTEHALAMIVAEYLTAQGDAAEPELVPVQPDRGSCYATEDIAATLLALSEEADEDGGCSMPDVVIMPDSNALDLELLLAAAARRLRAYSRLTALSHLDLSDLPLEPDEAGE